MTLVVVIAGRSGVTARRLADGKPAWPRERVEWPAGATLSGRGYLSQNSLHVPLSNAEIVEHTLSVYFDGIGAAT